jgi:hypothetical protein
MTDLSAVTKSRVYKKIYVPNFSREVVTALATAKGTAAPLYVDVCKRCNEDFTIKCYTALKQYKNKGRFKAPKFCDKCFSVYHQAVNTPTRPGNAHIRRVTPIPEVLSAAETETWRKRFEGTNIVLKFKRQVSFSSGDESHTPEIGVCVAVSKSSITINTEGAPAHEARTFALADLYKVSYQKRVTPAAVDTIAQQVAAEGYTLPERVQVVMQGSPASSAYGLAGTGMSQTEERLETAVDMTPEQLSAGEKVVKAVLKLVRSDSAAVQ